MGGRSLQGPEGALNLNRGPLVKLPALGSRTSWCTERGGGGGGGNSQPSVGLKYKVALL